MVHRDNANMMTLEHRRNLDTDVSPEHHVLGLLEEIDEIVDALEAASIEHRAEIEAVHPLNHDSAINFVHYLALRRLDLRDLQMQLAELGLSSLGRAEGRVRHNIEQVRARLRNMLVAGGYPRTDLAHGRSVLTPDEAETLLHRNSRALFGPKP